jgi:hypothetical protein
VTIVFYVTVVFYVTIVCGGYMFFGILFIDLYTGIAQCLMIDVQGSTVLGGAEDGKTGVCDFGHRYFDNADDVGSLDITTTVGCDLL